MGIYDGYNNFDYWIDTEGSCEVSYDLYWMYTKYFIER